MADSSGTVEQILNVECPEGCGPGDTIAVATPGGEEVMVEVPQGISAGMEFPVFFDCDPTSLVQTEDAVQNDKDTISMVRAEQEAMMTDPATLAFLAGRTLIIDVAMESEEGEPDAELEPAMAEAEAELSARGGGGALGEESANWSAMPLELAGFLQTFTGHQHDAAGAAARKKMWESWDANGNGAVSLAEMDRCVKLELQKARPSDGEELWHRYRPSYIRAFSDAADAAPDRQKLGGAGGTIIGDDMVTKREFRVLLSYLRLYATMYEVFAMVDGMGAGLTMMDDKKLSREEWSSMIGAVVAAGTSWAPFVALQGASAADFDAVDLDGQGSVMLSEFCGWVVAAEKAAGTAAGRELAIGDGDKAAAAEAVRHSQPKTVAGVAVGAAAVQSSQPMNSDSSESEAGSPHRPGKMPSPTQPETSALALPSAGKGQAGGKGEGASRSGGHVVQGIQGSDSDSDVEIEAVPVLAFKGKVPAAAAAASTAARSLSDSDSDSDSDAY